MVAVSQIREQNPKLAKQSSVLAVSMDNVYAFATAPRESNNAKGVVFRFMPDMRQVGAALDVRCLPPSISRAAPPSEMHVCVPLPMPRLAHAK